MFSKHDIGIVLSSYTEEFKVLVYLWVRKGEKENVARWWVDKKKQICLPDWENILLPERCARSKRIKPEKRMEIICAFTVVCRDVGGGWWQWGCWWQYLHSRMNRRVQLGEEIEATSEIKKKQYSCDCERIEKVYICKSKCTYRTAKRSRSYISPAYWLCLVQGFNNEFWY